MQSKQTLSILLSPVSFTKIFFKSRNKKHGDIEIPNLRRKSQAKHILMLLQRPESALKFHIQFEMEEKFQQYVHHSLKDTKWMIQNTTKYFKRF